MAECFLHVHMLREAKRLRVWPGMRFGPIAVVWNDTSRERYMQHGESADFALGGHDEHTYS